MLGLVYKGFNAIQTWAEGEVRAKGNDAHWVAQWWLNDKTHLYTNVRKVGYNVTHTAHGTRVTTTRHIHNV